MSLTSAAGLVSLLDDKGPDVKAFALRRLDELVDQFWAEISESVNKIEILHEDSGFPHNKLAALLASKVYYHLAEYEDALHFALCAEELFDISASSEFVETIISKCIDKYIELRVVQDQGIDSVTGSLSRQESTGDRTWSANSATYKRLEQVVNKMFDRCFEHKQYKQALGIAIETRRLDMFEKALTQAEDREGMLRYAFRVVLTLIDSVRLRNRLLQILVSVFMSRPTATDAINVCQCLVLIDDPQATANTLEHLLIQSPESAVTAYQIGFDLYENSTQVFLQRVSAALACSSKLSHLMKMIDKGDKESDNKLTVNDASSGNASSPAIEKAVVKSNNDEDKKTESKEQVLPIVTEETPKTSTSTTASPKSLSEKEQELKARLENLVSILSGDKVIELHLQFLIRNNKADLRLLERIRDEVRHSVTHNATVLANGIMHCGTTSDQFLRDHLNWLGKAVNWAKFTATATLGVIHRGHEKEALRLMSAYLPKDASGCSGSVYTEGGGLFALGLIHANHGGSMTEYLLNQTKEATAEPVRHGACLGLGLAAMGTGREDVYDQMKLNLYQDDAVTGEAAGIGIGLVMLGTGSAQVIEDLLSYAKETAHEKIIRGIALGIAMVMYGRLEEADELIDRLIVDNDPILRWAGMATIAMAYCGTGTNKPVQRLLHAAVSDTNDDVRRWAVTALGFVLFKTPDQVPALVSLLAESYHPHLRFGAAMAIGVACAGTASKEALALLETLYEGTVAFVRQGALVATAMVLMQQNGVTCPKSVEFREKCLKIVSDRHEDLLAKFGAILACGILDAGGCNMTISLQTRTGNNNMTAAVGLLVFQNFWFWYPLTNFISLALTPTTLIALNKDLKMPKMQFRSNAKASAFAYPQPLQPEKEKKREKVETAILSITAKQRKKEADKKHHKEQQQRKESIGKEEKMDVDASDAPKELKATSDSKEEKEPNFTLLNNPARVMRAQQRVMALPENSRYQTLKSITQAGILMVLDKRPQETEVLVELVHGHGPTGARTSAATSGTGPSGSAGSSDLVAGLGAGSVDTTVKPVHASTIGAFVDDDADDDDEDDDEDAEGEDEEDEGEQSTEDEDEEEEEEEGYFTPTVITVQESEQKTDVEMEEGAGSTSVSEHKRVRRKHATGAGSRATVKGSHAEPTPPKSFLYVDEEGAKTTADVQQATQDATSKESTSGGTSHEPMDVDQPDPKKPSDGTKRDSSPDQEKRDGCSK